MTKLHFYRRLRILVAGAMFLLGLCSILETEEAHAQDFGLPDSVYFGEPSYSLDGCSGSIKMKLPVFMWSDRYADLLWYGLRWDGNTECDTVFYSLTGSCDSLSTELYLNLETNNASDALISLSGGITPTLGTQKIMDCVFSVDSSDTIHVWISNSGTLVFHLGTIFHDWVPTIPLVDTQLIVPSSFVVAPGDVDCSSLVTISDAVYLIQYIFAGGCMPFDPEAADPNGDCFITISDAVYLINYIFAGGNAPVQGCAKL